MRIRVGLLLAVLLECGCAAYVHAPSRLTLPAAGACVRRSQQPMLAAVAQPESEDNLAAIFQRAVVGQDDAPAPRSHWTNYTLKPLGFLLAFVAAPVAVDATTAPKRCCGASSDRTSQAVVSAMSRQ